mmetsp:Transcript_14643/g.35507  ORF Transcript_14643/g.35507 Transcript_14643/m.35507 type:complete len:266 (+) Transcript_14643:2255-3052(+)
MRPSRAIDSEVADLEGRVFQDSEMEIGDFDAVNFHLRHDPAPFMLDIQAIESLPTVGPIISVPLSVLRPRAWLFFSVVRKINPARLVVAPRVHSAIHVRRDELLGSLFAESLVLGEPWRPCYGIAIFAHDHNRLVPVRVVTNHIHNPVPCHVSISDGGLAIIWTLVAPILPDLTHVLVHQSILEEDHIVVPIPLGTDHVICTVPVHVSVGSLAHIAGAPLALDLAEILQRFSTSHQLSKMLTIGQITDEIRVSVTIDIPGFRACT